MYKVIFNQDDKNFEEFETLEKAEKFAKQYANTEIEKEWEKMLKDPKMKIKKKPKEKMI